MSIPVPEGFKPKPDASVLIDDKDGKVVVDLGLMSVVMNPGEAEEFGSALIWHAAEVRRVQGD